MQKKVVIIVVAVLVIITIITLFLLKSGGSPCTLGTDYSSNGKTPCKKCDKCSTYSSQCTLTANSVCKTDEYGPDVSSPIFNSENKKNIHITGSLWIKKDEKYIQITESDLKRVFGGHTYDKYCVSTPLNDNCVKYGFNQTSPQLMKDNKDADKCKPTNETLPVDCIAKGPYNNFLNKIGTYTVPGSTTIAVPASVVNLSSVSNYHTSCINGSPGSWGNNSFAANAYDSWNSYILPVAGTGERYSKMDATKLTSYDDIDQKYELKTIDDLESSEFITVANLVVDEIQFNFDNFTDKSVSPGKMVKIQGGANFILDENAAGIISGTGGAFITNAAMTQNVGMHCSSKYQVETNARKWALTLPSTDDTANSSYIFYMLDPSNFSETKMPSLKLNDDDSSGQLGRTYDLGGKTAYTNDYICIGDTCVSAELFWMVIPGTFLDDGKGVNPINASTKEFVIIIPHELKDDELRHIYGNHAGDAGNQVKRSSKIKDICNSDHRWHFTPPLKNTKVNTHPWKPDCDSCNC